MREVPGSNPGRTIVQWHITHPSWKNGFIITVLIFFLMFSYSNSNCYYDLLKFNAVKSIICICRKRRWSQLTSHLVDIQVGQ